MKESRLKKQMAKDIIFDSGKSDSTLTRDEILQIVEKAKQNSLSEKSGLYFSDLISCMRRGFSRNKQILGKMLRSATAA